VTSGVLEAKEVEKTKRGRKDQKREKRPKEGERTKRGRKDQKREKGPRGRKDHIEQLEPQ
jgi:hypothetical protein